MPDPHPFTVDFDRPVGQVKLYNSTNKAPLHNRQRVPASFKSLEVPLVRLHDCTFDTQDVVDINCLFPLFDKDPDDPANYRFAKTDDYLKAILDAGSGIYFRLGPSIEHSPTPYFVHPPANFHKWARICVNIISHYRDGWASGHHWPIEYWEIWNEPEIGPSMWTGTAQQYYEMYAIAAKAIKAAHPNVKVGGPAASVLLNRKFLDPFFQYIKQHDAPLDFFSWHMYPDEPAGLAKWGALSRQMLDEHSFTHTENHCNEWNYFPGVEYWKFINDPETRDQAQAVFRILRGAKGAAFDASAIILAQGAPIDLAMFYTGDSTRFGFYHDDLPQKNYYVFAAMNAFRSAPLRLHVDGNDPAKGLALLVGQSQARDEVVLLISNFAHEASSAAVRLNGLLWKQARVELRLLNEDHSLDLIDSRPWSAPDPLLIPHLKAPAACLVRLSP